MIAFHGTAMVGTSTEKKEIQSCNFKEYCLTNKNVFLQYFNGQKFKKNIDCEVTAW